MFSRPTENVPAIAVTPRNRSGRTGNGPVHASRRAAQSAAAAGAGGLHVRDLESSHGIGTVGCSSIFGADPAYANALQNGGMNYSGANVQLIFWGSEWLAAGASPTPGEITAAIRALFKTSYFYPLKQYGINVGNVDQSFTVTSPQPPHDVGSDDITGMLWNLIGDKFPMPDDSGGRNIYVVFLPSSTGSTPTPAYDSAHSQTWHVDVDLPFDPIDVVWAYYIWIGPHGDLNGKTVSVSHELIETYTNPNTDHNNGCVISFGGSDPLELADACEYFPSGKIDGIEVTSYYSRFDNACIIPGGESLRLFLSTKQINIPTCLRRVLPPGVCLRQWMNS